MIGSSTPSSLMFSTIAFVDRQVDTFIVEQVGFVGNKMQLSGSNVKTFGFAAGAVYQLWSL